MLKEEQAREVRNALKRREFVPYFQPQYDYARKKVIGAEVLARWAKPDGSVGLPGSFIPVLEENGDVAELDYQVMEAAVKQLASWQKEGIRLPHTSFNLSRLTVMDENLISRIREIFEKYGFDATLCHMEITESAYVENFSSMLSKVNALREMSIIVEMDDFGSGYSSLAFLKDAPVDILKLDMTFLRMDANRGKGGSIISAMVRLAGNLGMQVIAEGVETLEQAEFLKSVGCYWMQGYFFSKPVNAETYKEILLNTGTGIPDTDSFREVNKALDFLDDTTQNALLFNSFVGGAAILEAQNTFLSVIRANDRFYRELEIPEGEEENFPMGSPDFLSADGKERFRRMLDDAVHLETEAECEADTDPARFGKQIWLHFRTRCLARKKNGTYVFYLMMENITERKKLDQKNSGLTAELTHVINNTPGGFIRLNIQENTSRCEFMSEGYAWMRGYSAEDLKRRYQENGSVTADIHPEDRPLVLRAFESMKNDLRGRRFSYRVRKKDGSWIRVGTQSVVVDGQSGLSVFIYSWDETEQERMRAKLEDSSAELQNITRMITGGTALYEVKTDGSVELLRISDKAAGISGRTPEEYMEEFRKDPYFCTYEEDKEKVITAQASLQKSSVFDLTYRVVHRDGRKIWVRLQAFLAEQENGKIHMFSCFTDLTESFDTYDALVGDSDAAIVVTEPATHEILYLNRRAAELGEIPAAEAIGHPCYQCLNHCNTIDQKCMAEIPEEGLHLEESRNGKVYEVFRRKVNWQGLDASVCRIKDKTEEVIRDNRLVELPSIQSDAIRRREALENVENTRKMQQREWEDILSMLRKRKDDYRNLLTEDALRIRIQFVAVYAIMGLVSFLMTVLNVIQSKGMLTVITFVFSLLSLLNVLLALKSRKTEKIAQCLFSLEILALFTAFEITGSPEGFSVLWSVLLPSLGLILYGYKKGRWMILIEWLILALLFWTAPGRSLLQYDYTATFMTRYPLLYAALAGTGAFFEYIRKTTHQELAVLRQQYEHLYNHDALTGLFNRYGFNSMVESISNWNEHGNMAFAIMDLDGFKSVNDTYGHMNGDKVLKTTAMHIQETVGKHGAVSRWGGEEFAVLFYNADVSEEICQKILEVCRTQKYYFDGAEIRVTISIGLVKFSGFSLGGASDVITRADDNLYTSKQNGKDQVTVTDLRS